ncbi:MAG: peptide chain release factor N(5)-glutamine methyltransferase [Gammaproteobacteria bacterium]|nr:peptide chain release factor N(5)-glutamine methyltransferase [Gammaproteobacteria bacterium]
MTIDQLLSWSRVKLGNSDSPLVDATALLCSVSGKSKAFLYSHGEEILSDAIILEFKSLVDQRERGKPIAYLTGSREFWSLDLTINPNVLIPRHDTELVVETVLAVSQDFDETILPRLLDLGSGSGAIALAVAVELLQYEVVGIDLSLDAVELAELNRARLGINNVRFLQGHWFDPLGSSGDGKNRFHIIVSNPPYIPKGDVHLDQGDVRFEPTMALVADENGFGDLKKIIKDSSDFLVPGGWIILEHGFKQGEKVRRILLEKGFQRVETHLDLGGNDRVTKGKWTVQ